MPITIQITMISHLCIQKLLFKHNPPNTKCRPRSGGKLFQFCLLGASIMNGSIIKRLRKLAKKIKNLDESEVIPEEFIFKSLKKEYKQKALQKEKKFLNLLEIS